MSLRFPAALFLYFLLGSLQALAQTAPNWTYGYVPTTAQWNAAFAAKQDYLGSPPCLVTGCILSGELVTVASTTSTAGFNVPPGTAPFAEVIWDGTEFLLKNPATGDDTVGTEKSFTNTVPAGWLTEDGSCYSRTTYAALFAYYGSTDLWATQAGSSCSGSQFAVPKANGRIAVAVQNQGAGTGPLTNCTAGVTNNCGAQFQFLTAGQIPAISAPYTPAGSVSGTNGGSQSISVASLESGSAQNYAFGGILINEIGLTIFGSSFSWSGTFSGTPATITVGSGSPSAVSIVNPNYQVLKAVKL